MIASGPLPSTTGRTRPSIRSRSNSARLIPVIAIVNECLCDRILYRC